MTLYPQSNLPGYTMVLIRQYLMLWQDEVTSKQSSGWEKWWNKCLLSQSRESKIKIWRNYTGALHFLTEPWVANSTHPPSSPLLIFLWTGLLFCDQGLLLGHTQLLLLLVSTAHLSWLSDSGPITFPQDFLTETVGVGSVGWNPVGPQKSQGRTW